MSADTTLLIAQRMVDGYARWTARIVQNVEDIVSDAPEARAAAEALFPLDQGVWFTGENAVARARALGELLVADLEECGGHLEYGETFAFIDRCPCPDDYEPPEERGNPAYE